MQVTPGELKAGMRCGVHAALSFCQAPAPLLIVNYTRAHVLNASRLRAKLTFEWLEYRQMESVSLAVLHSGSASLFCIGGSVWIDRRPSLSSTTLSPASQRFGVD